MRKGYIGTNDGPRMFDPGLVNSSMSIHSNVDLAHMVRGKSHPAIEVADASSDLSNRRESN